VKAKVIDGNFGAASGMVEMLLQSNGKAIEVFPALPQAFKSGKVTGLRARGAFVVDIEWEKSELVSTLHSLAGADCNVVCAGKKQQIQLKRGETVQLLAKDFY
jgi:alpha-L-fucosidase 2